MTKLKGAAILGAMMFAGVTLLTSFPASGGSSFLPISLHRLQNACRAVEGVDDGLCRITAGLVEKLGGLGFDPATPPDQVERAIRKLRPFVQRSLRQTCCDAPCIRECSGDSTRNCFTDDQCAVGQTCVACPPQPCQTLCDEFKGNRCAGCIQILTNFEAWLAANGSARNVSDVMATACVGRFDDPTLTQQCEDEIGQILGVVIDRVLANLPPVPTCQGPVLHACPQ
jgi:hypothetical protein